MRCFFIGGILKGNGWTGNERGAKRGLHCAFLRICKLLIFRVYFTGAGAAIMYIAAPCTCLMDCLKKGVDVRFYGWGYGCSEEMYYLRGNQR